MEFAKLLIKAGLPRSRCVQRAVLVPSAGISSPPTYAFLSALIIPEIPFDRHAIIAALGRLRSNREAAVKNALISSVTFALVMTLSEPSSAQDLAASIVGVWKITNFTRKEVVTGKTANQYGQHPLGMVAYTKGGHFLTFVTAEDRKVPAKSDPTDAERIELFKTMYGYGGTYKIDGNKLIAHVDTSWVQSWTGTDRPPSLIEINGKQTIFTTSPFKSTLDGQEIVVIVTWERIE